MGFFKKLGKGLKSVTKMASLGNLKKIATGNYVGLATEFADRTKKGIWDEFTKKSHKPAENLIALNDAQQIKKMVQLNPNIKDILAAALGGAFTGAGSALSTAQTVAEIGATTADNVATTWFKKNWLKAIGILTAGTLIVWGVVKVLKPKTKRKW